MSHEMPLRLFAVAALFPAVLAIMYSRHAGETLTGSRRIAALSAMGLSLLALAFVVARVLLPGDPLAVASVDVSQSMTAQLDGLRPALMVRGELPPTEVGSNVEGSFRVEVSADGAPTFPIEGSFEKHYAKGRAGRRGTTESLVTHLEERYDLPAAFEGKTVTATVTRKAEQLDGPLHLELVHAPPAAEEVMIVGGLLVLVGAAVDAISARRTWLAPILAVLVAYAAFFCHHVVPHGDYRPIVGAAMVSVAAGLPIGLVVRAVAVSLGPKPEPVPDSGSHSG